MNSVSGFLVISKLLPNELITRLLYCFHSKGSGWKIVASFEGKFPDRIKQLPLDRHFDLNNVKRVNSEAALYLIMDCEIILAYGEWNSLIIIDCVGSGWLSTLFDISREGFAILNKRSS